MIGRIRTGGRAYRGHVLVRWTATPGKPGDRPTDESELAAHFRLRKAAGSGYFEISHPDLSHLYPWMTFGFLEDLAVIEAFRSEEQMQILCGDGIAPSSDVFAIPVMDELASFTGEYVSSVDRAWTVVTAFIASDCTELVGDWHDL